MSLNWTIWIRGVSGVKKTQKKSDIINGRTITIIFYIRWGISANVSNIFGLFTTHSFINSSFVSGNVTRKPEGKMHFYPLLLCGFRKYN